MTEKERRIAFEALVLQGLWAVMLLAAGLAAGYRNFHRAMDWRADAIGYLDEHGNQSDGAKVHRRERAFPEIRA